jgi:hypothetical protein
MPSYVLIDNTALKIIKAAPTVEQCEAWAAVLCPKSDFRVQGANKRDFGVYSEEEIKAIIRNTSGASRVRGDYQQVVAQAHALLLQYDDDPTPLENIAKGRRRAKDGLPRQSAAVDVAAAPYVQVVGRAERPTAAPQTPANALYIWQTQIAEWLENGELITIERPR